MRNAPAEYSYPNSLIIRDDTRDTFQTGDFPWKAVNANDPVPILAMIYDPTNGTVSGGEIFRAGGQMPAGAAYSVLWASASR